MNMNKQLILVAANLTESEVKEIFMDGENIYLTLKRGKEICPYCWGKNLESKGYYKKRIRINNVLFKTSKVFLKTPRYQCKNCVHTFTNTTKHAPKNSSISYATIHDIMILLTDPKMTIKQVAKLTNLSATTVTRIFDKYCHISRAPFPEVLCIDEVYTKNSDYKAKYSCILYDFMKHTIVDVLPDRKKGYLHYYFQPLKKTGELNNVKYICIDMYKPYKQIAKIYFKKAIICVDSFHVINQLNNGLSKIRVRLMKSFPVDSKEYYLLKRFKYLLFTSYESLNYNDKGKFNKVFQRYLNFYQLRELLLDIHPDLRKGYDLKEAYMDFNKKSTFDQAGPLLDSITKSFIKSNIDEFNEFITSIVNWRQEIINSFILYKGVRINNGVAESLNASVKILLYNTRGIRNHERRRKRIMYAINKTGFTIK